MAAGRRGHDALGAPAAISSRGHDRRARHRMPPLQPPDLGGDLRDGVVDQRQRRDVGRQRDMRMMPERMPAGQRLLAEDVERRAGEMAVVERGDEVGVDDEVAARDVDEVRALGQRRSRARSRRPRVPGVDGSRQTSTCARARKAGSSAMPAKDSTPGTDLRARLHAASGNPKGESAFATARPEHARSPGRRCRTRISRCAAAAASGARAAAPRNVRARGRCAAPPASRSRPSARPCPRPRGGSPAPRRAATAAPAGRRHAGAQIEDRAPAAGTRENSSAGGFHTSA